MKHAAPRRASLLCILCLSLAACSGTPKRSPEADELGLDPQGSPAELYTRMAEEYYQRGRVEIAFRRARQALEADEHYPRAHTWMGYLYEHIGKLDEARQHYHRALDLAPKNSEIRFAYASFECRHGHYAEADADFRRALDNPLYTTPWLALTSAAECAGQAGNRPQAERYLHRALAGNPSFGPALVQMARLQYDRGDAAAAKTYLDRYFSAETVRTPATSYVALETGVEVERTLGHKQRADYYQRVLKQSFSRTPASRKP